jgi:hypothetical protein
MLIETVGCSEGSGYVDQTALRHISQNSKKYLLKLSVMTNSDLRAQQVAFLIMPLYSRFLPSSSVIHPV